MGKRRIIWLVNEVLLLLLSRFSHVHSVRPHRQQPTRLPRPWDSPGKNTGVGCHFLLQCNEVLVIHNYHPKESTAWERNRPRTKLSEFKWQTLNKGRTSRKNSPTTVTNQNEVRPEEPRRKDASRGGKVSDSVGCRLGNVSGASSTEVTQWLPAAASVTWRNHETRGSRSDYKVKRLRHRIQMLKKKKKKKNPQAQNTGTYTRPHHPSGAPTFPRLQCPMVGQEFPGLHQWAHLSPGRPPAPRGRWGHCHTAPSHPPQGHYFSLK